MDIQVISNYFLYKLMGFYNIEVVTNNNKISIVISKMGTFVYHVNVYLGLLRLIT